MTSILHLLQPGAVCQTAFCGADHVRVSRQPTVTLYGTTWRTKDGLVMDVSQMTSRHALNAYLYLHRTASRRAWNEAMNDLTGLFAPRGDAACDAVEELHQEMAQYPHAWLDETPLVVALWARVLDGLPSAA